MLKLHAPTHRLLLPLVTSNLFSTSGGIFTLMNFHGIPVYHYVYFIRRRAKRLKYFFVMPPFVGDRGAGRWIFPTLLNVPVTIQIPFTAGWSQRQVVWRACYFFDSNVPSASWNDFCLYIAWKKRLATPIRECTLPGSCGNLLKSNKLTKQRISLLPTFGWSVAKASAFSLFVRRSYKIYT